MSTTTSELPRIPIGEVRSRDIVEICEYSELWLKVRCVHPLPGQHCYRVDGTVYDRDRCPHEATVDFIDTETPRRAPTPPSLTFTAALRRLLRRTTRLFVRH